MEVTIGTRLHIGFHGAGLQMIPRGRTARLVEEDGVLVATGEGTDEEMFALIDAGRR